MVSVGVIVWLASELMFFAGLFGIYFTVRAQTDGEWPPAPTELNVTYAPGLHDHPGGVVVHLPVRRVRRGARRRLLAPPLVPAHAACSGTIFVLGQANEYRTLVTQHETTLASSPYGTVFYLTTGFHGLHVIGGLIAFVLLIARTKISKFTPAQATSAIVVSYYWHFVDVVWIGLFATIYIIQ